MFLGLPDPESFTILWHHFDFSSLKTDVNVPTKSNKQKNFEKKKLFFVDILSATDEKKQDLDPEPDP